MLKEYKAPNGLTYRYEEGEQPEGYVPAGEPKAAPKRRATANKRRTAQNKKVEDAD